MDSEQGFVDFLKKHLALASSQTLRDMQREVDQSYFHDYCTRLEWSGVSTPVEPEVGGIAVLGRNYDPLFTTVVLQKHAPNATVDCVRTPQTISAVQKTPASPVPTNAWTENVREPRFDCAPSVSRPSIQPASADNDSDPLEALFSERLRVAGFSPDQVMILRKEIRMAQDDVHKTVIRLEKAGRAHAADISKEGLSKSRKESIKKMFLDSQLLPADMRGKTQIAPSGAICYSGDGILELLDEPRLSRENFVKFDTESVRDYFIAEFQGRIQILLSNRETGNGEFRGRELRHLMETIHWKNLRELFAKALEAKERRMIAQTLVPTVAESMKTIISEFQNEKKKDALGLYFELLCLSFPELDQHYYLRNAVWLFRQSNPEEWPKCVDDIKNAAGNIPGLSDEIVELSRPRPVRGKSVRGH